MRHEQGIPIDTLDFLPISTDVVLFTIRSGALTVLLVEAGSSSGWRLPGGRVQRTEPLDAAADRHLQTETGVKDVYLEQLYTFGCPRRADSGRLISVAYYALVPMVRLGLAAVSRGRRARWFAVAELPPLVLDHGDIISLAHRRLAAKLGYSTIALQFMPEQFTLRSLQQVYEAIRMETLDKRNFRKKILGLGCLQDTGRFERPGPHRPAKLYRTKDPGEVQFIR